MNSINGPDVLVPVAAAPGRSRWTLWHILLALIGNAALGVAMSGCLGFIAGSRNANGAWPYGRLQLVLCGVWLIALAGQIVGLVVVSMRPSGQTSRRICFLLTLASIGWCPGSCGLRVLPDEAYERGFGRWVMTNVDISALRSWHAALPSLPSSTVIPPASWPANISLTAPAAVELLPNGAGIVLQWGRLSTWGDSRKLFVGPNADSPPPPDTHHLWRQVAPGVFVARQVGG
jgi:hypothetical protein